MEYAFFAYRGSGTTRSKTSTHGTPARAAVVAPGTHQRCSANGSTSPHWLKHACCVEAGPSAPSPEGGPRGAVECALHGVFFCRGEPPGSDRTRHRSIHDVVHNGEPPAGTQQPEERQETTHVVPVVASGMCRDLHAVALAGPRVDPLGGDARNINILHAARRFPHQVVRKKTHQVTRKRTRAGLEEQGGMIRTSSKLSCSRRFDLNRN